MEDNKFVIVNLDGDVQLIMQEPDEGNLLMFNLCGEDKEAGQWLVEELEPLCRYLNWQENTINEQEEEIKKLKQQILEYKLKVEK